MMPKIENLTSEEEKAIEELHMRVKNVLTPCLYEDDTIFYRFLKARDFDIDKAEKMLRNHITWRKIYQADTILDNFKPSEFFQKYIEPSIIGFCKEGNLVVYNDIGSLNIYDVFKSIKLNDFLKGWTWFGEKRCEISKVLRKNGNKAFQMIIIMNLDKLTLGSATSKLSTTLFLEYIRFYQENYPERMKALYLINAPGYYVFAFSILKAVMSNATVRKIHVFGRSGWKEKLLEHVEADILPAFLGGNRTDSDGNPLCETFVSHGGEIPQKYFLSNEERYFTNKNRVETILVPSTQKKELLVDVKEAGLLIQWEFLVNGKDIGFGLYYKDSEQGIVEVIPVYKYTTTDGTERNSYKCHSAGKYIILFDNSYSWLTSKTVDYCITILKSEM